MTKVRAMAAALLALACSDRPPAAPADGGPAGAAPPAGGPEVAYVTAAAALRRQPTDATRVPGEKPRAAVPNLLATLLRGEKVAVVEWRDEWVRVRASDESDGWLRRGVLLPGLGVTEATLAAPADAFDRPDLLAVNARRKIEPGTLLLVMRSRELFSEVNVGAGPGAWLLTDRLSTGPRDVMVAKLIEKSRWLRKAGRPEEARPILELARAQFADVPLVQVLAAELGEGAPDGGAAAPDPPPAPPSRPGAETR